jgi:hypothetical protein
MENIGKNIILGGVVLIVVGGLVFLAGKSGLPLGRLPGDIRITGKNGSFYFPITTCILLSVLLTAILTLARYLWRK